MYCDITAGSFKGKQDNNVFFFFCLFGPFPEIKSTRDQNRIIYNAIMKPITKKKKTGESQLCADHKRSRFRLASSPSLYTFRNS